MPRLKTPRLVTGTRIAVASEQTVIKLRWISRSIRRAPTLIKVSSNTLIVYKQIP